jgi:hypothetical protein
VASNQRYLNMRRMQKGKSMQTPKIIADRPSAVKEI